MKQSVRTIGNTLHFDRVLHPQDCPMTTHRHVSYSSTWHPTVCQNGTSHDCLQGISYVLEHDTRNHGEHRTVHTKAK